MVNVDDRPASRSSANHPAAPAAGCFGYTRSQVKPFMYKTTDPNLFAMLYAMSGPPTKR